MASLDSALALAERGFFVFPLMPNSKVPAIGGWKELATRDPDRLEQWWDDNDGGYNIGIYCGKFGDNQYVLGLDADVKGAHNGFDTLLDYELHGKVLVPTYRQRTPSTGSHFVYSASHPVRNSASSIGPGLDVRGEGGYLVGAGSAINGALYVGTTDRVSAAPGWLLELCEASRSVGLHPDLPRSVHPAIRAEHADALAIKFLDDAQPAYQGRGGDNHTYAIACRVRDYGVVEQRCFELMALDWNMRCEPPWDLTELKRKVHNAYHYAENTTIGVKAPAAEFVPVAAPPAVEADDVFAQDDDEHELHKFNRNHAYVRIGAKHAIAMRYADNEPYELVDERTFHSEITDTVEVDDKRVPLSKVWMRWSGRKSYRGIEFAPGKDLPPHILNLWDGFTYEPEKRTNPEAVISVNMWFDHLKNVICDGDEELYKWTVEYFAHMIQRPWEKPGTMLVIQGSQGTGKGSFIRAFGTILGEAYMHTSNLEPIIGRFNTQIETKILAVIEEAVWAGDHRVKRKLQELATEPMLNYELKFGAAQMRPNCTRVVYIGNPDHILTVDDDDRRCVVYKVSEEHKEDIAYFRRMYAGMEQGGYELLHHALLNVTVAVDRLRRAPKTEALLRQKLYSQDAVGRWWVDSLREGTLINVAIETSGWPRYVPFSVLYSGFLNYAAKTREAQHMSHTAFSYRFKSLCTVVSQRRENNVTIYELPTLEECRTMMNDRLNQTVDWENDL